MRIAKIALIGLLLWTGTTLAVAPRLKTVYTIESSGSQTLNGVWCRATLILPDSAQGNQNIVPYNTVSGAVYSIMTPTDSAQSTNNGRCAIRLALTPDIYPPGCRWMLSYEINGAKRRDVTVTLTDTTTECLQKVLGQAASCP